ncbi:unnamed protein product [Orchesella dallaii]|uniref:Uncharacterized protein n=1 Tax=Orchesella dallaii TaxID=48710 RepID=A0ABP1Q993_9HEXA
MSPSGVVWHLLLLSQALFYLGHCKTVQSPVSSALVQERRIDNFVEFTDEGDQLAVESTLKRDTSGGKRDILDKKATGSTGRECANVQKAVFPIIPVIVASVIGLVGSIIISVIGKIIFSFFKQSLDSDGFGQDSGGGWSSSASGYGRRQGYSFFGLENIDYSKLIKNVFKAIEKVHFCTKVLLVSVIFNIYFDNVSCANIREDSSSIKAKGNSSKEDDNETFSNRQLPLQIANPNTNYFNTQASFGFPLYNVPVNQNGQILPNLPFRDPNLPGVYLSGMQGSKQGTTVIKDLSSSGSKLKDSPSNDPDTVQQSRKNPKVKQKKKQPVESEKENYVEIVESKTDEGTERNCPGCVGGTCDPTLGPNTNISGIPVIQIIIGLFAGIFWAKIFLFIFKNFIEQQPNKSGGYEPAPSPQYGTPQYGAPQASYGAPAAAPVSGYNTNRISYDTYAQPYGRSFGGSSFGDVSRWVWDAIEKFILFLKLIEFVRGEELQSSLTHLDKVAEENTAVNDTKSNPIDNGRGLFIAPRIKRKKLRLWNGENANLSKSDGNSKIENVPLSNSKESKGEDKIVETLFETKDEGNHPNGRLCPVRLFFWHFCPLDIPYVRLLFPKSMRDAHQQYLKERNNVTVELSEE